MLLVQEYLKTKTLGDLIQEHGVYYRFSKCGRFFSLSYDQIEARESELLSQQCRGLILANPNGSSFPEEILATGKSSRDHICPGETIVASCGFFRFFNDGQGAAAPIDWQDKNLKIFTKADGTCAMLWANPFSENEWNVATRSSPQADIPLDSNSNLTFRTLFEKALLESYNLTFKEFTSKLNRHFTYTFELVSPYNRIVVDYPQSDLFFIGARHLTSLKECSIFDPLFEQHLPTIKRAEIHTFANINDIVDYVSIQNPLAFEGVVICDSNFNRIKVKNAKYVAYNKLQDRLGTSDRNCLELILCGQEDDILAALPKEIQTNLLGIREKYKNWLLEQQRLFHKIYEEASAISSDKKTFALTIKKNNVAYSAAFFNIFDKKANDIKDFIAQNKTDGTWSPGFLDKILDCIKK